MSNPQHTHTIGVGIMLVLGQVAAIAALDDELTQCAPYRAADTWLVRQYLQRIKNERQHRISPGIAGSPKKFLQAHKVGKRGLAKVNSRHVKRFF